MTNPYRHYVFLSFTVAFTCALGGLISPFLAVPLVAVALVVVYNCRFEQLPLTSLRKFDSLFGLNISKDDSPLLSTNSKGPSLHRIILHRGGCINSPENTLEAIREAAKEGVAGVEIDLQFTSDGVGILLHDDTLERTTNATGDVREMTYGEVVAVDAAAKHKNRENYSSQVKIPTLEECLKECIRLDLLVFIDCKAFARKTADLVDELFNKYPVLYDMAAVCSFYPNIVFTMRRKNPRVITALTYRKMALCCDSDCVTPRFKGHKHYILKAIDFANMWVTYAWSWYLCGNSFLLLNKESLSKNEVQHWKDLGVYILPWTVNSEVEKQHTMQYLQLPIITDGL